MWRDETASSRRTAEGSVIQKRVQTVWGPTKAVKTARSTAMRRKEEPTAAPVERPRHQRSRGTATISAVARMEPVREAEAMTEAYMAAAMAEYRRELRSRRMAW